MKEFDERVPDTRHSEAVLTWVIGGQLTWDGNGGWPGPEVISRLAPVGCELLLHDVVDHEAPPGAHVLAVHPVVVLEHEGAPVPDQLRLWTAVDIAHQHSLVTHPSEHSGLLRSDLGLV